MERISWKMAIEIIRGAWLALVGGASYRRYDYKSPVRIKNWKPEPAR